MPFDLDHGDITALGFRIGGLAYTPDVSDIPETSLRYLEGLDVWIVDALRYRAASLAFQPRRSAALDRADAAAASDPDEPAHRPRL